MSITKREIKFRVWADTDGGPKMVYLSPMELCDNGIWFDGSEEHMENHVVMQYTGMRDKTGREIYEGDILDDNAYGLWRVEWIDGEFVAVDTGSKCNWYSLWYFHSKFKDAFVAGNIYENKDIYEHN